MSELKNGFLTAEEVMDILQVKQSKAYQIIRPYKMAMPVSFKN